MAQCESQEQPKTLCVHACEHVRVKGDGSGLRFTARRMLTKFFKEGLHKAGPRVQVCRVHIQEGDFLG